MHHRLQKLWRLYYLLDPNRNNPIGSTGRLAEISFHRSKFLWKQPEYSPFIDRFCYDISIEVTKSPSRFQEWTARLQECTKLLRRRLRECKTIQEYPIYKVVAYDFLSSSQYRSESHANDASNLHYFIFIGKPRKGNNPSNVHFSWKIEQELSNKKTQLNITGDDGK